MPKHFSIQDVQVWRCCFLIMIIAIIVMYTQFIHRTQREQMTALDILSFVWGAVCQQGTHLIVPTTSGRFIVLTTFIAPLAIFTSYSASIVALLQSPSHMIQTIDDLIKSSLKMYLQEAGYNRNYFIKENITLLNEVYEKKIKERGEDGWVSISKIFEFSGTKSSLGQNHYQPA